MFSFSLTSVSSDHSQSHIFAFQKADDEKGQAVSGDHDEKGQAEAGKRRDQHKRRAEGISDVFPTSATAPRKAVIAKRLKDKIKESQKRRADGEMQIDSSKKGRVDEASKSAAQSQNTPAPQLTKEQAEIERLHQVIETLMRQAHANGSDIERERDVAELMGGVQFTIPQGEAVSFPSSRPWDYVA